MKAKTSAHYQREYRRRLREQGLVKKEVWIRPENSKLLSKVEKQLRDFPADFLLENPRSFSQTLTLTGDSPVKEQQNWTTYLLYEALRETKPFSNQEANIELIDGLDPVIHVTMYEHGDLPIYINVCGEQILVEALLWPEEYVTDTKAFNETVLRTHKLFPLSTISLDQGTDNKSYYYMFGALSASSILANVLFELEVLANNVIEATEAYKAFLILPKTANV